MKLIGIWKIDDFFGPSINNLSINMSESALKTLPDKVSQLEKRRNELYEAKRLADQELQRIESDLTAAKDALACLQFYHDNQCKELRWVHKELDMIVSQDLDVCPASVLDQLVLNKYKVEKVIFWSPLRTECGHHELTLTPPQYYNNIIRKLKSGSCIKCYSLDHTVENCPKHIPPILCEMCFEEGHSKYCCTKRVCDLYKN